MRILLVEDTEDVADAIASHFGRAGHAVDLAATAETARDSLAVQGYDLIVLDINLPDGSGFDILRELRLRKTPTPVLVLTARLAVEDRVSALDVGADDYLVKPFDLRELEARARALLRRARGAASAAMALGGLVLDPAARTVTVNGGELVLTRREFRLLEILLAHSGRVLAKEEIHAKLFGFEEDAGLNAVELYVARLRRKTAGSGVAIRTLRGLGYQLSAEGEADGA